MKALVCELCGSNDFSKENGYFVCQHCGTKYSLEEARKLIVEIQGSVDISGSTIKVDNTSFVERYLANARRAKQKGDWEEAEKYYNMVEQNEPSNIEAIFYSSYSKAKKTLYESDFDKRRAAFGVFERSISIIDDNYDVSKEAELKDLIIQMVYDVISLSNPGYVLLRNPHVAYGLGSNPGVDDAKSLFFNTDFYMVETLTNIIKKFPSNKQKDILYLYKLALHLYKNMSLQLYYGNKNRFNNQLETIDYYVSVIKKYDPNCAEAATNVKSRKQKWF